MAGRLVQTGNGTGISNQAQVPLPLQSPDKEFGEESTVIQAAQTQFLEHGFCFPIRILTPTQASEYCRQWQEYERTCPNGRCAGDDHFKIHLLLPWAWDLVHHPRIVQLACACLQTNDVWCSSTDVNTKEAHSSTHYTWHQDSTYAGITPASAAVTLWLALTPSTQAQGCLNCLPSRSHLQPQLPHAQGRGGPENALSLHQEIKDIDALNLEDAVCLELQPGQASVHSFLTVHKSGPNRSQDRRIGFAMRFVAAHATKAGNTKESATLVSGHGHDLFVPETKPHELLGVAERSQHKAAMARERANYLPQGSSYS